MKYYTLDEASTMLRVPVNKLIFYINSRKLRALQLGSNYRIRQDDLIKFLRANYGNNGIDLEAKI
ncbi:MAG: helix-turn-helix domain-containing protein [bacterium]